MKSTKLKDYVNMSVEDLQKESKELKSQLFKLRFQHAMSGLDNPKKISQVKKEIARVNTIITQKSINNAK